MFFAPIKSAKGLSDYQLDYIEEHTKPKKVRRSKMGMLGSLIALITMVTTVGLCLQIYNPELLSEPVNNYIKFGVVSMTIIQIFGGVVLVLAMLTVDSANLVLTILKGLAKATDPEESQNLVDVFDARAMMDNRIKLTSHNRTPTSRLKGMLRWSLSMIFAGSMIAVGYVFAPICLFLVYGLVLLTLTWDRFKLVKHIKSLDPRRVARLESVQKSEDAKDAKDEAEQREKDGVITIEGESN